MSNSLMVINFVELHTSKLEMFRLTKEIFVIFGAIPNWNIFRPPFNQRGCLMLLFHFLSMTLYSLYVLFDAHTFDQYANGGFLAIAVVSACFVYVICLYKRKAYLMFMTSFVTSQNSKNINMREYSFAGLIPPSTKSIYITFNRYVESIVDTFCVLCDRALL